ncbi:hypothetical protein, partial [Bifidobacterium longum]|uniref:hypothetical protein n=1 Tax=Bifidobacterium longum TaxID=216816 RepID=UPI001BE3D017
LSTVRRLGGYYWHKQYINWHMNASFFASCLTGAKKLTSADWLSASHTVIDDNAQPMAQLSVTLKLSSLSNVT